MKKNFKKLFLLMAVVMTAMVCLAFEASAETWGDYEYSYDWDGYIEIEQYSGKAKDLVIPSEINGTKVVGIGSWAFQHCESLKSVTIPDSVMYLSYGAFQYCDNLNSVTIGKGLVRMDSAFYGCSQLENFSVSKSNKNFSSDSYGVLYNKEKTVIIEYPVASKMKSYKIPSTVTVIDSVFADCKNLISVTIPNSVTSIGSYAFAYCTNLENIKIPDTVTRIDNYAFAYCTNLEKITIPDGVITFLSNAFAGCTSLTSINLPSSLEHLSYLVFANCKGLTSLKIPSRVKEIAFNAFDGCIGIESFAVDKNNKNYSADSNGVLFNKNKTELIKYPPANKVTSYKIPNSVNIIGTNAFKDCKNLTNVVILDSVTAIRGDAFASCSNLKDISIPDSVTEIGTSAFSECGSLEEAKISKNVTSIAYGTFNNCTSLESVQLPKALKNISFESFYDCKEMEDVYFEGSEAEWKEIRIGEGNDYLTSAKIHYNFKPCTHKKLTTLKAVAPTCTKDGKTEGKKCKSCGKITVEQEIVAKKGHTYKTTSGTKATLKKNGKQVTKCTVCGYSKKTTIYYPKSIKLSATSFTYNGKAKKPTVTVKDSKGKTLRKDTDYTVKYSSGRKNPGKYTVTVTFKGKYSGSKKLAFEIKLGTPTLKFKSATAETVSLKWSKIAGAEKYELYQLKGKKWEKVGTSKKTSGTVKDLKSATIYKFAIRAIQGENESAFSEKLTVETPSKQKKITTVSEIPQSTSAAMKYLKKNVKKVDNSYLIPGLNRTVTASSYTKGVTTCPSMTPQGMTVTDDYLLISAYCNCGKSHYSVIYVIDKTSHKYLTTLILDTTCHVGGIAKQGDYLWVCDSSRSDDEKIHVLRAYNYSDLKLSVKSKYTLISAVKRRAVDTKPSYMCSANGYLYVGSFSEKSKTSTIYYYSVNGTKLKKQGSFKISGIRKIQGISILDEYMVVTSSYGRENKSKVYIYNDVNGFKTDEMKYSNPIKEISFPNMLEACYMEESVTYFLFESGAEEYRASKNTMPLDKYVSISNSKLGIS